MSQLTEQKSLLAKLMASENIRIEHRKIQTASFDPTNRVMHLPIWQDMEGHTYDLLTGHECGHALYTPAEGWHNSISQKGKNFKAFLNVVEDARIEKKVQRKYPGLRQSFKNAYHSLFEKDFFGVKGKNIDELHFVDRLNLYTKSQYSLDIEFSEQELVFVERAKLLETWEEVVQLAEDIFEYSKKEQKEKEKELEEFFPGDIDDEYNDSEDYEYEEGDSEGGDDEEDYGDVDFEETKKSKIVRDKDSSPYDGDDFEPSCETDETFRANEYKLLDSKSKDYVYIKFPKPNLQEIVTPANRVHELLSESFYKEQNLEEYGNTLVKNFKEINDRYISLLAKEFEMRKAAKAYDKRKLSDTGDIDVSKLASYKFDDNIFRKLMRIPKGKSHGLVLLLDYSGSMVGNMAGSIEQILVLSLFCKKVNIPFTVYSFGNHVSTYLIDKKKEKYEENFFSSNEGELQLNFVQLREYLNSDMPNSVFRSAFRNMLILKQSFEHDNSYSDNRVYRPLSEKLSNTPLTEAIVTITELTKTFKTNKNLDITNLVIVHDGDSDRSKFYKKDGLVKSFSEKYENVVFVDPKIGFHKQLKDDDRYDVMNVALEWFSKQTGSNVFGFYIIPHQRYAMRSIVSEKYLNEEKTVSKHETDDVVNELVKEKFVISYNYGYQHFYFIVNNNLKTEADKLVITGSVTTSKLKTAFMKMNRKKQINRILVSKFIQGIAV